MKVLHVIPSISRLRGGPSQAIFEMVDALRQEGVDAQILTTNDNADAEVLDLPLNQKLDYALENGRTVPLYCFDRFKSSKSALHEFTFSKGLTQFLWKNAKDFDLIHIHAIFSYPSVIAMAIANWCGVPYVIRPLGSLCTWSLEQSQTQKQIYLGVIRRFLDQASGLHLTAQQEQQEIQPLGIKAPKFIVPLGLNRPSHEPLSSMDFRQKYGIDNQDPILLFLSRIHPKKGIEPLLQALSQLPDKKFNLIIAGNGSPEYEASIQAEVDAMCLASQVKMIGFVKGHEKQELLNQADLFVLTSYSENFGIVVLESLASGTPTLVTPGVALAPMVRSNDIGWVCDLEPTAIRDTLQQALTDPDQLDQKGQRAQRIVQTEYNWSAIATKLQAEYQKILPSYAPASNLHSSRLKNA